MVLWGDVQTACACGAAILFVLLAQRRAAASVTAATKSDRLSTDVLSGVPACVGCTPLVRVSSLSTLTGAEILLKVESKNPGGSAKDRVALRMIRDAVAKGLLRRDGIVVEGSSGSTGISLAVLSRALGYRCAVVLPDDTAAEKRSLLTATGADVRVVPPAASQSAAHYVNVARALANELNATYGAGAAFYCNQFESASNAAAHYETTGPEIWAATRGHISAFVMGAGTGGTLAGVGRFLREAAAKAGSVHPLVVLADPPGSALFNRVAHGVAFAAQQAERTVRRHRTDTIVEGVGLDRVTTLFSQALPFIDGGVTVSDAEAVAMARFILLSDGLFIGPSTAVHLVAAARVAATVAPPRGAGGEQAPPPAVIVTLLCDSGERYLSRFWSPDFIAACGLEGAALAGTAAAAAWTKAMSSGEPPALDTLDFLSWDATSMWRRSRT